MKKEINTVLMDADYKAFKTAFKRSILGVTYSKYKRKKGVFYQQQVHNEQITDLSIEKIWSDIIRVRKQLLDNPDNLKLKARYEIEWNIEGKIIGFNNVSIDVLKDYGSLLIQNITMESRTEPVHLYLFTSDLDFSSKEIKDKLTLLINDYDENEISFNDINLSTQEGREKAKLFKVTGTPTLCIDEIKIENPKEKDIKNLLERIKFAKIIAEPSTFTPPKENALVIETIS